MAQLHYFACFQGSGNGDVGLAKEIRRQLLQGTQLMPVDIGPFVLAETEDEIPAIIPVGGDKGAAPPRLPPPRKATRFLTTRPPRSASIKPASISATDLCRSASANPVPRIQRLNVLVLNIRFMDFNPTTW